MTDPSAERFHLAERISDWLDHLDLGDDDARTALATSLATILATAATARTLLDRMLGLDPIERAEDADAALEAMVELNVQLVSEMKWQIESMEHAWPVLEDRLIELSPDDVELETRREVHPEAGHDDEEHDGR